MPHGGPHQKTTTFKEQKSDRPKGMPAFLSYTAPPKKDSWKTLSTQQLTERFNKNQQSYKKDFLKKHPKPLTSTYGYGIPEYDDPKEEKIQREIRNRKSYRWAQDPKVIKANKKALEKKLEFERQQDLGYFSRVSETKDYFDSLAIKAKRDFIQPNAGWFEKTLKSNAIDAWFSTGNTIVGTFEGALGLTLDPAANFVATTIANGNELYNNILGMDVSPEDKDELIREIQEHLIGSTMAYWESNAYGGMKIHRAPLKHPELTWTQTAKFVKKKIPFTWNNSIKTLKTMKENIKAKNMAKNMTIEGDWSIVAEAAMKEPAVKTEIKQLTIQSLEHSLAQKVGNIGANNIANHLRVKNNIMPVAPLAVGAGVTPKELLPLDEKGPFFNPVKETVYNLPEIVSVKDLKEKVFTKKNQRVAKAIGLNDFIAELDAGNRQTVSKAEIENYVNNNPYDISVKVTNVSAVLPKDRIQYEDSLSRVTEMHDTARTIVADVLYTNQDIVQRAGETMVHSGDSRSGETYSGGERAIESAKALADFKNKLQAEPKLLDGITEGYFTSISEGMTQEVTAFEPVQSSYENFKIGKFGVIDNLPNTWGRGFVSTKSQAIAGLKKNIMLGLGYAPDTSTGAITWKPIEYGPLMTEANKQKQINWSNELLDNALNREIETTVSVEDTRPAESHQEMLLDSLKIIDEYNIGKDVAAYETVNSHLDSIISNLQANDFPEWSSFINAIEKNRSFSLAGGQRTDFNSAIDFIEADKATIAELKANAKKNELIDTKDFTPVTDSIFYEYETTAPKWDDQKTYKLETSKNDVFMNLKVVTNKLKKFPVYGDTHFPNENMLGWILGTEKIIKGGQFNGKKNMIWEEVQSSSPITMNPIGGTSTRGTPYYGEWTMAPITKRMNLEPKAIEPTLHDMEGTTRLQTVTSNNVIRRIEKTEGGERFITDKQVLSIPDMTLKEVINYENGLAIKNASDRTNAMRDSVSESIVSGEEPPTAIEGTGGGAPTMKDYVTQEYVDIGDNMLVSTDNILDMNSPIHIVYNAKGTPVNFYQILDGELFFNVQGANKYRVFNTEFNTHQEHPALKTIMQKKEAVELVESNYRIKANTFHPRQETQQKFPDSTQFIRALDLKLLDKADMNIRTLMGQGSPLGKADWYRKVALSGLRYAYDRGMDFITIPSGDSMKHKKPGQNIKVFYGEVLPNVFIKWGLPVSEQHLIDMGVGYPGETYFERFDEHPSDEPGSKLDSPSEWFIRQYGDDGATVIDLRDKNKIKEILQNINEPVASLDKNLYQQTNELFSRLA